MRLVSFLFKSKKSCGLRVIEAFFSGLTRTISSIHCITVAAYNDAAASATASLVRHQTENCVTNRHNCTLEREAGKI